MALTISCENVVVFDLDDTLYKEIDFTFSAFRHIARLLQPHVGADLYPLMRATYEDGKNAFDRIMDEYKLPVCMAELVALYRFHEPVIDLCPAAASLLECLHVRGIRCGLVTDGRSQTQRSKLRALGLTSYFSHVVISEEIGSEKPAATNFSVFEERFPKARFVYVADNPRKDFVQPNHMGWRTIGLRDDGRNIHPQNIGVGSEFCPHEWVDSLAELVPLVTGAGQQV